MQIKKIAFLTLQVLLAVVGFLFAINAIELGIQLTSDANMSSLEHHDKVLGLVGSPLLMALCFVGAMWLKRKRGSPAIKP